MGAAFGASRAVCDAGWMPHPNTRSIDGTVFLLIFILPLVSQTIQHLADVSGSKVIVAINKDAEAPIFKVADYGIVESVQGVPLGKK